MLNTVNLTEKLKKKECKRKIEQLQGEISVLQQKMRTLGIPMMIVFEGWDCAGKGRHINELVNHLDTRAYTVYSIRVPNETEICEPFMWRYWQKIPIYGKISVFDESWYQEIAWDTYEQTETAENLTERYQQINEFERQLADDGYEIVKLFFHISQKEQKRRQEARNRSGVKAWHDYRARTQQRRYDKFVEVFDDMMARTDTEYAPWHLIAAEDAEVCCLQFLPVIRDAMQNAILRKEKGQYRLNIVQDKRFQKIKMPLLSEVDITSDKVQLSDEAYKKIKKQLGKRLAALHNQLYERGIPLLVLYEGWDAGGKGGNIRRLTEYLDPRGYQVIPTSSPDFVEKNHQYLWRFWRNLPKDGHIAIFDRTWYGRVMVERIEGFCREDEWQRAYREINEFEASLNYWGAIIVKFWIHIDADEQLRRFTERQKNPDKQWKITDEDWRNREKWPQYEEAVNDMLRETSTDFAPWTIIEGNNKKFARIKAMKTIIQAIEERLQ